MLKSARRIHYFLAVLSSIFIFLFISRVSVFIGKPATYLVLIILVTLNVWFGGLKIGFFTITAAVLHYMIFFLFPVQWLSLPFITSLFEIALFIIAGTLIGIFIEKYKKTDVIRLHTEKETLLVKRMKDLDREVARMQKEVKQRDEFLSIATHELKTPLTSMLLKIQMILHNIRSVSLANFSVENLMQMLETAEQQTKRLSKMINDLLNVSLITTGRMNLELKKENVTGLVREVIGEFSEKLQKEDIKLIFTANKPFFAEIDKVRIDQVITNLVSNAIKYGNGKPIEVKVSGRPGNVYISVSDHGKGIPAELIEKIFVLFERGANGKDGNGLGVGLYISNQIVKAHNGKIKVESKPGKGSVFIVELPVK